MIWSVFKKRYIYFGDFFFNYILALLNTTQLWFSWQKMGPDWLWSGLVHLNKNIYCITIEKKIIVLSTCRFLALFRWYLELTLDNWGSQAVAQNFCKCNRILLHYAESKVIVYDKYYIWVFQRKFQYYF